MSIDASGYISEQSGQVEKIITDVDTNYAASEILLGVDLSDDALKTNIAIALVDFYVAKIEGKNEFAFGTPEYDAYDDKLRTWEDIIKQCLRRLELKNLVGSDAHKPAELQRNLATYFRYSGII